MSLWNLFIWFWWFLLLSINHLLVHLPFIIGFFSDNSQVHMESNKHRTDFYWTLFKIRVNLYFIWRNWIGRTFLVSGPVFECHTSLGFEKLWLKLLLLREEWVYQDHWVEFAVVLKCCSFGVWTFIAFFLTDSIIATVVFHRDYLIHQHFYWWF